MAANPERWEYPYDIGFVYYRNREYSKAAEWFRKAAGVPADQAGEPAGRRHDDAGGEPADVALPLAEHVEQ
jgi:hypothetical protein